VGVTLGSRDGPSEGSRDGPSEGCKDGSGVSGKAAIIDGPSDGTWEDSKVGEGGKTADLDLEGFKVGAKLGCREGPSEGALDEDPGESTRGEDTTIPERIVAEG